MDKKIYCIGDEEEAVIDSQESLKTKLEQIKAEVEDISIKRGYHEYYFKSPKEMKEEMLKILDKYIKELEQ